jgi:hypothetical protein
MTFAHRTAFVVVMLAAIPAFAQEEGDSCSPGTDPDVCTADSSGILACDTNQYVLLDCDSFSSGSTCDAMPCTGSDCASIPAVRCLAERGGTCEGISPLFDDGPPMNVPCAPNNACTIDASDSSETCTPLQPGVGNCTVADLGVRCEGDLLVACVGYAEDSVVTTPGVLDCGAAGLTCVVDADDNIGCDEPPGDTRCGNGGAGDGSCVNNVAHSCSNGAVVNSTDCTTTGRACVVEDGSPICVVADEECGPAGLGACSGNVATICSGGTFENTVDCTPLGRRCGPVDANGQIGCAVGGEGEGEGEGECRNDDDCDSDETCEDGSCERDRSGGGRNRGTDTDTEETSLFSCATSGAGLPAVLALLGVLVRRRRR